MKKFLDEFKTFALKGNVVNLAVGVIIGAAFQNIIKAFTDAVISPILARAIDLVFRGDMESLAAETVRILGIEFGYGLLITSLINFIITAFVLFIMVRAMNRLTHEPEPAPAPDPRRCPYCFSAVHDDATKCPACASSLEAPALETN